MKTYEVILESRVSINVRAEDEAAALAAAVAVLNDDPDACMSLTENATPVTATFVEDDDDAWCFWCGEDVEWGDDVNIDGNLYHMACMPVRMPDAEEIA